MKERNDLIGNYILFLLFSLMFSGFTTSFFTFILPTHAVPQFWILIPVYWGIHRSFSKSVLFIYLNTLVIHAFTTMPFGILLTEQLVVVGVVSFVRSRIHWPTLSYFVLASVASAILLNITYLILSWMVEPLHASTLPWREMFWTLLLAPLVGTLIFWLGRSMDAIFPVASAGATKT